MTPDDLSKLRFLSEPRIDPTGDRIAVTHSRIDFEKDRYDKSIWMWDASEFRAFTAGPGDTNPRWSPDGRRLAFLRAGEAKDANPQLAVMPSGGGEGTILTDLSLGVEEHRWSADGRFIVVVGVTWTEEWDGLSDEERRRKPRRISFHPYRFDSKGWVHDRRRHLWLIDPSGVEAPRCLTPGEFDETEPAWAPDGSRIAFLSRRDVRRGLDSGTEIWEVEVGSGKISKVAERGMWVAPSYRPDGYLHALGNPDANYPVLFTFWRLEVDGTWTDLTGHLDRSCWSLVGGGPQVEWWDQQAVLSFEDAGRVGVIGVDPTGGVQELIGGERAVVGYSVGGGKLAATISVTTGPPELHMVDRDGLRSLTTLNDGMAVTVPGRYFTVESDGHRVDAWAYLPEGEASVPMLLDIHGGPASQFGFGFFDEFQVYAGAGYGVIACNPRGSSGRGLEFLRAVTGDGWGTVDLADVTAVVGEALRLFPRLDRERIGVMGGSYGGFLTAWLIGQDRRYRSAVVERGCLAFPSFSGTSDIATTFPLLYLGEDSWEKMWEKSPLRLADGVETPTLVVHSEEDFRCPIEQGEQYFIALLEKGVPTEMLRFPGASHEMSRSGKPLHRKERFEAILDWHSRYLRTQGSG
jgi:dipeptidyl aminopeptidase/acylaminoacyl peptidase